MAAEAQPPLIWLRDGIPLPLAHQAQGPDSDTPGLVALGGRLSPERLFEAYSKGIFPWYNEGQPALWWAPDPRMVLATAHFKLRPSLKKTLRRFLRTPGNALRFDSAFLQVIKACANTPREGQNGTWIGPDLMWAYLDWHRAGFVHSVETWVQGELVGGLYFVNIGHMCFGESMFSLQSDASKFALAALVAACVARGITLIDCQQNTHHLASMGGHEMSRAAFTQHLALTLGDGRPLVWSYDENAWQGLAKDLTNDLKSQPHAAEPT